MPFARVGAMPQPAQSRNKQDKRKGSSNFHPLSKPKGITIEDLKKQTALRLAQEQQQKLGDGYFVDLSTTAIRQPLVDQQVPVFGQFAPSGTFLVQQSPSGYPIAPINGATMIIYPNANQQFSAQLQLQQNPRQQGVYNRLSEEYVENTPNVPQDNQQQVLTHCLEPDLSQRSNSLGSHDLMLHGKPKLPHGLTVHELKQMTKARLQAEGPDTLALNDISRDFSLENRGMSPLDFDSLPENRDRTSSRDSGYCSNHISHGPGSTNSIPTMVQVNQQFRDPEHGRQPQISPLPAIFHSAANTPVSAFNRPKADTWENLSIASEFSENHGSESVYSVGVGSAYSQPIEASLFIQGSTLRGHPGSLTHDDRNYPTSAHTSPSHGNRPFDATIGGNRRRAMTHSPRAVSIHEDQPILHSNELRIPSFSASAQGALQSRPSRNYSPVLALKSNSECTQEVGLGLARTDRHELRRPGLDSVASLPTETQNHCVLHPGLVNNLDGYTVSQTRGDVWNDGVSSALTESFLRTSKTHTAPPGFRSSTRGIALGSSSQSSDPWSGGPQTAGGSPSEFTTPMMDGLANDMGSILKLSGAGADRPDRQRSSTYPYANFR